jgi:hypothetical protein
VIVALPPVTPVTTPEVNPMVATDILLLVQLPPPASVNVIVEAAHTILLLALIAAGTALTLKVAVLPLAGAGPQPAALVMVLIVKVVLPRLLNPGIVNDPVPPPIVSVAVPVPLFAPLKV